MPDEFSTEWHPRAHFAAIAEALGITTAQIILVLGDKLASPEGVWQVLWAEALIEDPHQPVWGAVLEPDTDGILQLVAPAAIVTTVGELVPRFYEAG